MRIIVQGEQGEGKDAVARMLAVLTGYQIVREWDGTSPLPTNCVAETNCERISV